MLERRSENWSGVRRGVGRAFALLLLLLSWEGKIVMWRGLFYYFFMVYFVSYFIGYRVTVGGKKKRRVGWDGRGKGCNTYVSSYDPYAGD